MLDDILAERNQQNKQWGEQEHDHGWWLSIIGEEYGESCKAANDLRYRGGSLGDLRMELIQTAATAAAFAEALDREMARG